MSRRHFPHSHEDSLGSLRRVGEIAICPGCDKVVKVVVHYQTAWWRPMLWPFSMRWRRRLMEDET